MENEILKARQAEILRCLITSSEPLDIPFFMDKFQKKDRTVRYDIRELKDICGAHNIEIRYMTKKGYYIPVSDKAACSDFLITCGKKQQESLTDDGEEERCQRIFLYLFAQKHRVSADKMAEYFFVSRSTLMRFLAKTESRYGSIFTLDARKSSGYRLEGDEQALRFLAGELLADRFQGSYRAQDWYMLMPAVLKEKIRLQDIIRISGSIKKMNLKYNIWASNAAFLNLMSYCIARHIRLYAGQPAGEPKPFEREASYVTDLLAELSEHGEGQSPEELKLLSECLAQNGIYAKEGLVEEKTLQRIMTQVMRNVAQKKGTDRFDMESLYQDLYAHLKNFLNLSACGSQQEENLYILDEVKEHYYSSYQLAAECAELIRRESGFIFNATETCYLAVYFYKNSIQKENDRKNVFIVCATGKGLSHLLTLRIKNVFPTLNVVGQISPYQLSRASDLKDVDFVISTIPLDHSLVPVVKISRILSDEDIRRIKDFLRYGKLVDDIPLDQNNEASFAAKDDPFSLGEKLRRPESTELVQAATMLSKLIMTLLEYTAKFPPAYTMSKDAILGMIIHMSMAVPRWFEGTPSNAAGEEFEREYKRIRDQYPDVFLLMEKFFELVEETLQVKIQISERVAFYMYTVG